ncbi:MAG TPA: TonB family protein [Polyangiaceae bacterium]|jgi:TonB family protein|nr:TonB family protein [Polyangiaceae bacterium]
MARRFVGSGAFATSVVAHALLLACGALLLSHSLSERARSRAKAPPPAASEVEVELPTFSPVASEPERDSPVPEAKEALPAAGGGPLERHPDTERAGRGGSRTATEAATNLASSIDPITLETETLTHLDRSQVSRLHTAAERRSWDDHRATPNPMELTFLATGPGVVRERRTVEASTRGSVAGSEAASLGGVVGGAPSEPGGAGADPSAGTAIAGRSVAQVDQGALRAAPSQAHSSGAEVLLARPWVMRARPALPTETRERPNDVEDSSEAVASRVAALIHASTAGGPHGPGVGGEPVGGRPGRAGDDGMGSRATASGFGPGPDMLNDPGIQKYAANLKQRVDDQLRRAFPDWAIEAGRSGHVIFELAVLADGRLESVHLVRPSGIEEYDGNVMTGVRRIPSFGPLPKVLGSRFLFLMSYDALNRVVGRDGPGPGSYGVARQNP